MKRRYIGFEVVKEYYTFCKQRLESNRYRIKAQEPVDAQLELDALLPV